MKMKITDGFHCLCVTGTRRPGPSYMELIGIRDPAGTNWNQLELSEGEFKLLNVNTLFLNHFLEFES